MAATPAEVLAFEAACAALANVAANSAETQALVAAAGAIPLLAAELQREAASTSGRGTAVGAAGSSSGAGAHAARALRNLASRDVRNKLAAVEAGALRLGCCSFLAAVGERPPHSCASWQAQLAA